MSSREGPHERGRRRGRRQLQVALEEFHIARLAGSISQAMVAGAVDRSDAWVSWTETGQNASISVVQLSELLACVGLDLSVRAYPSGGELRDAAQLALLARFVDLVVPPWRWATEVPIPIPGDLRAWDGVLRGAVSIGVDAETRIRDLQAVDRRVMLKLRDNGLDRAILLVADTRTNRSMLSKVDSAIRANYPVSGREAMKALGAGRDPGGNAVVLLSRSSTPRADTSQAGTSPPIVVMSAVHSNPTGTTIADRSPHADHASVLGRHDLSAVACSNRGGMARAGAGRWRGPRRELRGPRRELRGPAPVDGAGRGGNCAGRRRSMARAAAGWRGPGRWRGLGQWRGPARVDGAGWRGQGRIARAGAGRRSGAVTRGSP